MENCPLTYKREKLIEVGPNQFGVTNEQIRFSREQIVKALCSQAILFTQTGDVDTEGKTVTSEIDILLKTKELVRTVEGRQLLFIDK